MSSLLGKGMESTSGQETSPCVKHRSNSLPDAAQESHSSAGKDAFDIKDAIYSYAVLCRDGTATSELLEHHVAKWTEYVHCRKGRNPSGGSYLEDFAACPQCRCFLHDPVTIPCGRTYCKICVSKLSSKTCAKCGQARHRSNWADFKTNVVIANVIGKWWPEELKAAQLKQDGNKLFLANQLDEAVEKYAQAFVIASNRDHMLAGNLSHAHLQLGQAIQALEYAEVTIGLRPDWPKGYCRKGFALLSLGRYEDAAVALLQCLALEPHIPSIIVELTKVLHCIICKSCCIKKPFLLPNKHRRSKSTSLVSDDISVSTTCSKRKLYSFSMTPLEGFEQLSWFLDRCQISMDVLELIDTMKVQRTVDLSLRDKSDFECTLCLRTFWQPVTTPCGHVFCRTCLDRCLDHTATCPLCKSSLEDYLAERRQFVTEFINVAMKTYISEAYAERKQNHLEELNEVTKNAEGSNLELPVFVCTVGFPTVPCPLHIFEPRYRLMIRRCLESGTRFFGMCAPQEGSHESFSDYGTTLEIRDVQYFPDGRAVVDAVGRKRFRVLERNIKDGYHTAMVEYLKDQPNDENEALQLHEDVHSKVLQWFRELNPQIKNRILGHFGPMPDAEMDYLQSENGPAWVWWTLAILPLDAHAQLSVLSMTSLQKRLEALHRMLTYLLTKPS